MSNAADSTLGDEASAEAQRRILNRLKRARGQLNAVIDSVEEGADCRTVVAQLSAVTGALDKAGFAIISTAMRDCLSADSADSPISATTDAAASAPEKQPLSVAELEKLFLSLA
jgi:DNA-binding FrmR family transcriptional regulator